MREKMIAVALLIVVVVWGKTYIPKIRKKDIPRPITQITAMPKPEKITKAKDEETLTLEDALARLMVKKLDQKVELVGNPFQKFDLQKKLKNRALEYTDIVLSGIIYEQGEPLALMNDEIFKVGDTIAGFKVEAIRQNEVVITRGMEKHMIKLFTLPTEK